MFVLMLQRVSSRVSGFPVASPCLWGKLQNLSVSKVSKQVVMSFCVTCVDVSKVVLCGRRNTFASFSQDELQFSVACAAFWRLHTPQSTPCLYTSPSTLYIPHFTLYTLHTTLYTPHSTLHPLHSTLHTSHSTLHTLHFTLYTLHSTLHTLHFTTPHFTLHILHSTLYTLHSTLHTPHFTLHTLHSHTLHSRLYTPRSTFSTPPSSIFHSLRCTGMVTGENVQDCSKKLFHKSVLRDCISMCFDICTINIHVSIRVRGLHLLVYCWYQSKGSSMSIAKTLQTLANSQFFVLPA